MARKKEDTSKSVALFDDFIESKPSSVKPKKEVKKEVKKVSRSKKEADREASTKKTNKLTSKKKTVKKDDPGKATNNSVNKSRSSSASKSNNTVSSSKSKKEVQKKSGRKSAGASDIEQKPKTSKRSSASNTDTPVKKSDKTVKSGQSTKTSSKSSKAKPVAAERVRVEVIPSPAGSEKSSGRKSRDNEANEEILRRAKANRHKQSRTSFIQGPKQITGKPKSIRDDLVAIVIDGEYLEVSPWSVKDGIYHQGLDSNFIVKYLHFDSVTTKYDSIDKKEEKNK